MATARASNITAPTQFIAVKGERYAYRRFGAGSALPLLCLQHFTGTLDKPQHFSRPTRSPRHLKRGRPLMENDMATTSPEENKEIVLKAFDALLQFRGIRIELCDGGHFYFPSLESFSCRSNFCAGR